MVSALGLDVAVSCAAARANVRRIIEIDDLLVNNAEGEEAAPVAVHRVPMVSAGFFGLARLSQLGSAALDDLLRSVDGLADSPVGLIVVAGGETYRHAWLARARTDSKLAAGKDLNAYHEQLTIAEGRIRAKLPEMLLQRSNLQVAPKARLSLCDTAAGFVSALQQAEAWLAKEECDRCVIGGVDSFLDPTTLEALNQLGLLKTGEHPVGMIPGEGASFLLVESPRSATRRGAKVQAIIDASAVGAGPAHPRLRGPEAHVAGDGLSEVMSDFLARLPDAGRSTGLFVVNLNGDPYRAAGWGASLVHPLAPLGLSAAPTWVPPLSFGDTGAATGAISVAMLARGWARGYAPSQHALVCLMDDRGARGAIHVRAAA